MPNRRNARARFVTVLPAAVFSAACATTNPPPTILTNPPGPSPTEVTPTNPPARPIAEESPTTRPNASPELPDRPPRPDEAILKAPPPAFSPRYKDGKACFVQGYANPPYTIEVSCTAPLKPPAAGETWCTVDSAKKPVFPVNVSCEEAKK